MEIEITIKVPIDAATTVEGDGSEVVRVERRDAETGPVVGPPPPEHIAGSPTVAPVEPPTVEMLEGMVERSTGGQVPSGLEGIWVEDLPNDGPPDAPPDLPDLAGTAPVDDEFAPPDPAGFETGTPVSRARKKPLPKKT